MSSARWVGFRLDSIAAATLTSGALLSMAIRRKVAPELLGLALTNVLQLSGALQVRWRAGGQAAVPTTAKLSQP